MRRESGRREREKSQAGQAQWEGTVHSHPGEAQGPAERKGTKETGFPPGCLGLEGAKLFKVLEFKLDPGMLGGLTPGPTEAQGNGRGDPTPDTGTA